MSRRLPCHASHVLGGAAACCDRRRRRFRPHLAQILKEAAERMGSLKQAIEAKLVREKTQEVTKARLRPAGGLTRNARDEATAAAAADAGERGRRRR